MAEFGLGPREIELLQRQMEEVMAMERNRGDVGLAQPEEREREEEQQEGDAPEIQATTREMEQTQVGIDDLQAGTFVQSRSRGLASVARRESLRLDYTAPLMQLLLQSFFMPWFEL